MPFHIDTSSDDFIADATSLQITGKSITSSIPAGIGEVNGNMLAIDLTKIVGFMIALQHGWDYHQLTISCTEGSFYADIANIEQITLLRNNEVIENITPENVIAARKINT